MAKFTAALVPTLPKPEVYGLFPDRPGSETNLLPEALTRVDLKFWFTVPSLSNPTLAKETVELYFDGSPDRVAYREWTRPIVDTDRYVELPQAWLRSHDGEHKFYYIVTIYNGTSEQSHELVMTVDTVAPTLANPSKLGLPSAVLPPNKLTALYLEQNSDQLKANLSAYTTPKAWDRIFWFWGTTPGNTEQGGVIELTNLDFANPVVITVPGDLIRDRNNGLRYMAYEIQDRAGNMSPRSDPVELDVAVSFIPRNLLPPKVKNAGESPSSGILKPGDAVNGATAFILPEADVRDGESVIVQWAEKDSPGSYRADTPITPGSREYHIPSERVRYHIDRTLTVGYEVYEPGFDDPHTSRLYNLQVERLTGTPTVQCDQVTGGQLKVGSIADGGQANFSLERWTHMGTEQFLRVSVIGADRNTQLLEIPVLTDSPVPEVAQKISAGKISKADLQRFKPNNSIEVRVMVSFDGKLTWQRFTSLTPLLVD